MRPAVPQSLDLNMSLQADQDDDESTPTTAQFLTVTTTSACPFPSPEMEFCESIYIPTSSSLSDSEFRLESEEEEGGGGGRGRGGISRSTTESSISCSTTTDGYHDDTSDCYPDDTSTSSGRHPNGSESEDVLSDSDGDECLLTPTNSTFLQSSSTELQSELCSSQTMSNGNVSTLPQTTGGLHSDNHHESNCSEVGAEPSVNGVELSVKPNYTQPDIEISLTQNTMNNDNRTLNPVSVSEDIHHTRARSDDVTWARPVVPKSKRVNSDNRNSNRSSVSRSMSQRKIPEHQSGRKLESGVSLKRRSTFSTVRSKQRGSEGDVLSAPEWSPFLMRRASELAHKVFSYSRAQSLVETVPMETSVSEESGTEIDGFLKSLTRTDTAVTAAAASNLVGFVLFVPHVPYLVGAIFRKWMILPITNDFAPTCEL